MNTKRCSIFTIALFACLWSTGPAFANGTYQDLVEAGLGWLAAAGPDGADASFPFDAPERLDWRYTPGARAGLMIGDMTAPQKKATRDLMRATLSAPGVLKAQEIMRLEAVLAEVEGSSLSYRNPEGYYVSLFGDPGSYPWGWRLEGHHLSINVTLATPNDASATPLFIGTNPAFPPAGAGFDKPIQQEEMSLAFQLIDSLNGEQAQLARAKSSPRNIVAGPGRSDAITETTGVSGAALDPGQRRLLRQLIAVYVGMARDEIGQSYMKLVDQGLEETAFLWAGHASEEAAFYYRIHGPRVLIEFDNTRGGNHIHAVWRDPSNDFGQDLLKQHYDSQSHSK